MKRVYVLVVAGLLGLVSMDAGATPPPWYVPSPAPLPLAFEGTIRGDPPFDLPVAAVWYDPGATWPVKAYWCGFSPEAEEEVHQQVLFGGAQPPDYLDWEKGEVTALAKSNEYEPRRVDVWGGWGVSIDFGIRGGEGAGPSDLMKFPLNEGPLGQPDGDPLDDSQVVPEVVLATAGADDFPSMMGPGVVWQTTGVNGWDIVFANLAHEPVNTTAVLTSDGGDETRPMIWMNGTNEYLVAYQTDVDDAIVLLTVDAYGNVQSTQTLSDTVTPLRYSQPTVSSRGVAYQVEDNGLPNMIGFWSFDDATEYLVSSADIGSNCQYLLQPRLGGAGGRFLLFLGNECWNAQAGLNEDFLYVADLDSGSVYKYLIPGPTWNRNLLLENAPRYDIVEDVISLVDHSDQILYLDMAL